MTAFKDDLSDDKNPHCPFYFDIHSDRDLNMWVKVPGNDKSFKIME